MIAGCDVGGRAVLPGPGCCRIGQKVSGAVFFFQAEDGIRDIGVTGVQTCARPIFARPVGGIVAGHYGDKIGRKAMLVLTLLIMGGATFLIGLLPTYQSIGIWAPILLIFLRLLQGFGIGGEWGGAVLMAVEHSPANRRGFFGSWPQIGVPAGLLLANLVFLLVNRSMSEEAWLAWGWRIPFLLSIILIGVGMFIRLRISETPAFNRVRETHTEAGMPIIDVLRTYPKQVLQAMGMRIAENGAFYVFSIFALTYVTELGLDSGGAQTGVLIGAAIGLFSLPFWGWLSDRIGRRPVYLFGAVFSLLFAFPFFWLMNTETTVLIWVAIILSLDRKSTRLNSSHANISYAVFCLKKTKYLSRFLC